MSVVKRALSLFRNLSVLRGWTKNAKHTNAQLAEQRYITDRARNLRFGVLLLEPGTKSSAQPQIDATQAFVCLIIPYVGRVGWGA